MNKYTVYLYRSGRVRVTKADFDAIWHRECTEQPIATHEVEANSDLGAVGKVALHYYDASQQTFQNIPICIEPCCTCYCGLPQEQHTPTMDKPHNFKPQKEVHVYPCDRVPCGHAWEDHYTTNGGKEGCSVVTEGWVYDEDYGEYSYLVPCPCTGYQ